MKEETLNKSCFAILPSNVRYDKRLKDKAKLLYAEITSLTNDKGFCWASNNYFAQLYNVSKGTISKLLAELKLYGYINIELIYKNGTKEVQKRIITLSSKSTIPMVENDIQPIVENDKENNIKVFNNIIEYFNSKNCFSKVKILTKTRQTKLLARLKENKGAENIFKAIDIASNSDFLKGKNDRNWKMDFDWLINNDTNIVKILEGKYSNKLNKQNQGIIYELS